MRAKKLLGYFKLVFLFSVLSSLVSVTAWFAVSNFKPGILGLLAVIFLVSMILWGWVIHLVNCTTERDRRNAENEVSI